VGGEAQRPPPPPFARPHTKIFLGRSPGGRFCPKTKPRGCFGGAAQGHKPTKKEIPKSPLKLRVETRKKNWGLPSGPPGGKNRNKKNNGFFSVGAPPPGFNGAPPPRGLGGGRPFKT